MSAFLKRLLPLFERESAAGHSMVLATVICTSGSTYTKPGALMLIAKDGEYAGLLSGGCLEGDLAERARVVFATGRVQLVRYDMYGADDLLFGLGTGCQGIMGILLQRLDEAGDWQPLKRLAGAHVARRAEALLIVAKSGVAGLAPGAGLFLSDLQTFGVPVSEMSGEAVAQLTRVQVLITGPGSQPPCASRFMPEALPGADLLFLHQAPAAGLLLLGAGPDSQPVAELAVFLGWDVCVVDHRSHYAQSQRFKGARLVLDGGPTAAHALLQQAERAGAPPCAAIVMSHHLAMDRGYLAALADSNIPYIGLLGPASRRERILADLGSPANRLRGRLRSPAGLNLGAGTPEAIALSIIAEIQAAVTNCGVTESLSVLRDEALDTMPGRFSKRP